MTRAVIMAGGFGRRLSPLTDTLPKPLIRVGERPIIEQIVRGFVAQGIVNITIAVHYEARQIEAHLGNGERLGAIVDYVRESSPLGTAGALRMMDRPDGPVIVSNADILTRVGYADLLQHHDRQRALMTVCLAAHSVQVPYGVAVTTDDMLTGIEEKPVKAFPVLAGVYVLSPEALDPLPRKGAVDMPDLVRACMDAETGGLCGVATYHIRDFWIDMGTPETLEAARGMVA